jgi:hypothetical protein
VQSVKIYECPDCHLLHKTQKELNAHIKVKHSDLKRFEILNLLKFGEKRGRRARARELEADGDDDDGDDSDEEGMPTRGCRRRE